MARKHFTALGEPIDMAALSIRHSTTVALGNAKMNARGDILGEKGVVLRTQEQIDAEWRRLKEQREASVGVSQNIKDPLPSHHVVGGKMVTDDQDFDPEPTSVSSAPTETNGEVVMDLVGKQQTRKRRVVDSDQ